MNLAIPRPTDALIVESLEGTRHGVRVSSYAGTAAAYHSTACGRALLAHRPEAERRALYALGPLVAATPATVTDAARLEAILATCRARGWVEAGGERARRLLRRRPGARAGRRSRRRLDCRAGGADGCGHHRPAWPGLRDALRPFAEQLAA